uniref:Guided entry of tail-anchored proteins factor 1 n=1 Tax=Elaeophora elaphi TaxID=1147741 RepID=A0A0R3RV91_9BILA
MICLTIADIVSQWNGDKFGILACFLAIFTFTYWLRLTRWLAAKLKPFLPRGNRHNAVDSQIKALSVEVRQMKSDLDALSPTAQFAAYFKKQRSFKRRLSELNALTAEREKNSGISSTLLLIASGIFVKLIAISLMFYSRNVIIGHINSAYFWPFNFLLYIPNFSIPISGSSNAEGTPVTLFAFLSLVVFVWHNAFSKAGSSTKMRIL